MTRLRFLTEWLDPHNARGDDLRATWASLRIEVQTDTEAPPAVVTRFYDRLVDSRRHSLNLPLYPLAEWIAFHWFQLLHGGERDEPRHHDLRAAAGGYTLPALSFWSQGEEVLLRWEAFQSNSRELDFDAHGECLLPRAEVEQSLTDLLHKVAHRLEENAIRATPFQKEWQRLLELEGDERDFCVAAATLGLDPFDVPEEAQATILAVASQLPAGLLAEFLPAATPQSLGDQAQCVAEALALIESAHRSSPSVESLRDRIPIRESSTTPWSRGYEVARHVRKTLSLPGGPVALNILVDLVSPIEARALDHLQRIDGIVARNGSSGGTAVRPQFLTRHPDNVKFALARLLFESLLLPPASATLVTREKTARQKANRAFAAEFLAPAAELVTRLPSPRITREEVAELAGEFGVSTYVIEKQLQNHRLAEIRD
jgi:hypothetical protein